MSDAEVKVDNGSTEVEDNKGKAPAAAAAAAAEDNSQADADRLIAEGKKAIALRQWEDAVAKYADALGIMRDIVGEFDPKMAPLLLSYGKSLYELAFSQQGAIGKEEVGKTAQSARKAVADEDEDDGAPENPNFQFAEPAFAPEGEEGEGEEEEEQGEGDEHGEGEEQGEGEQEGAEEPEDDYNAAWEVLDVARSIYTKVIDEHPTAAGGDALETERLQLADTYIALGDVSCETENFAQAVSDYTSALAIQEKLLPASSRSLASTHYQLATSLEFLPQKRSEALSHVQSALASFTALRAELADGAATENEGVKKMSAKDKESERKEVDGLIADLEVKIEELKTTPETADDLVKQSLDHLLGKAGEASGSSSGSGFGALADLMGAAASASAAGGGEAAPVNDLTSMVRKKPAKKAPQPANANGNGNGSGSAEAKRKAEENPADAGAEKKAKAE